MLSTGWIKDISLIVLGGVFGGVITLLVQLLQNRSSEQKEKLRVYTHIRRMIEEMLKWHLLEAVLKEAGGRKGSVFDEDLSYTEKIPANAPVRLPEDFDNVVKDFADWEAEKGRCTITTQLLLLKSLVQNNCLCYNYLVKAAKNPELGESPEFLYFSYNLHREQIEELLKELLGQVVIISSKFPRFFRKPQKYQIQTHITRVRDESVH